MACFFFFFFITEKNIILQHLVCGLQVLIHLHLKFSISREYGAIDDCDIDLHIDVSFLDVSMHQIVCIHIYVFTVCTLRVLVYTV